MENAAILKWLGPELSQQYQAMLSQLAGGAALDEKNAINLAAKSRERDLLQRFNSQMSSRGFTGGLSNQGQLGISRGISNDIFQNIAAADARARSEAVRAMLGLGDIAAKNKATHVQKLVGMAQASAAKMAAQAAQARARNEKLYNQYLIDQQILAANAYNNPYGDMPQYDQYGNPIQPAENYAGQLPPEQQNPVYYGSGVESGYNY